MEPNQKVSIELKVQEWDVVLQAMQGAQGTVSWALSVVSPVLQSIIGQVQALQQTAAQSQQNSRPFSVDTPYAPSAQLRTVE